MAKVGFEVLDGRVWALVSNDARSKQERQERMLNDGLTIDREVRM